MWFIMRLTYLPVLACAARLATAAKGAVYTYNLQSDNPSTPEPRVLTPEIARLVVAQRLGLEDFHAPEELDEERIRAINDYGKPTHLFGKDRDVKNAFILVENVAEDDGRLFSAWKSSDIR